ncbi:MAG TPA: GDP-mannose 4,6-dehydratase [Vicinamibacterales bacterium]|jgi:GDP-4-dehydro-6-deoxy-D-mannose reductase
MTLDPILVTGAAGFAGSHLLDLLEADAGRVVAWRRPGERLPQPPTGTRCRWMAVELLDARAVREAVETIRPSRVYHLAGAAQVGGSWQLASQALEVNVLGTQILLDAVAAAVPAAVVLVSGSALVYREHDRAISEDHPLGPGSPYAMSKLAQEMAAVEAAADLGLRVAVTRSFPHIGPRQAPSFFTASVARQIARIEHGLAAPVLDVGNLESRRDFTDVRDTVRAYHTILERAPAGAVYNVCSGTARRMGDILESLLQEARTRIEVRRDPSRLRPHDESLVLGDRSRLTGELGWEPRIPMSQTLGDLLDYWRHVVASGAEERPDAVRRPASWASGA